MDSGPQRNNRNALTYHFLSAPGRNRTYDTRFRKPLLYPLSYGGKGR